MYFKDMPEVQEYLREIEQRQRTHNEQEFKEREKRESIQRVSQPASTNQIRAKPQKAVPNFLSNHMLMQSTTYNYKIEQGATQEVKKTVSVEKLP